MHPICRKVSMCSLFNRGCTPWLLMFALLAVGCGGSTGPAARTVSGVVTLDGEPLKAGEIRFRPADGLSSGGAGKIEDGKYSFLSPDDVMRVEILAYREIPGKFVEPNPGERYPATEQMIPAKYNENSELTAEVQRGQTEFNFELESK